MSNTILLSSVPPLPAVLQPGDWSYTTGDTDYEVVSLGNVFVCSCAGECKTEWEEANARAIACLPALLRQLNVATAVLFNATMLCAPLTQADKRYLSKVVADSNRVLNKALGQDPRE